MVVEAPGETAAGNRERRGYGAGVGIHSRGAGDIMRGKARFIRLAGVPRQIKYPRAGHH